MTMGELAASIAHEINQPLAAIVSNGSACLRWLAVDSPNLEEAREAARRIVRDGNRAGDVMTRIRAFLRKTDTEKSRLDINQIIQEVVILTQDEAAAEGQLYAWIWLTIYLRCWEIECSYSRSFSIL